MKNVWKIFAQDLRNLRRVPLVALLLLGLAILPSLYAWFNLGASWDPYANTEDIKVVIVNEDAGAELEGEEVNLGQELVNNLKENESLGWVFADEEQAEEGIRQGDYYAGIFVGSDFSEQLVKIVDGEPVQTSVRYQVNQKKNAIAPKMTSAGASTIVNMINDQFVEETSNTLFREFDNLGIRIEEELPTIRRIEHSLFELDDRMPEIVNIGHFIEGVEQDWGNIEEQIDRFMAIQDYLPQIHEGADQILALQEQIPRIYELSGPIAEVEENIPTLEKAVDGFNQIGSMFDEAEEFLDQSQQHIADTREQMEGIGNQLDNVNEQASSIEENIAEFQQVIGEADLTAAPFIQSFQSQLVRMDKTMSDLQTTMQNIEADESVREHQQAVQQSQQEITQHIVYLQSNAQIYQRLYDLSGDEQIAGFINEIEAAQSSFESMEQHVNQLVGLETLDESLKTALQADIETTQQHTNSLTSWLETNGESSLNGAFNQMKETVASADFNMDQLHEIHDVLQSLLSNADGVLEQADQDINQLREDMPAIKDRWQEINQEVQQTFPVLVNSIGTFQQFMENDLPTVEQKVNKLADFIEQDLPGIEQSYLDTVDKIEENLPTVESAIHELASFSRDRLPELQSQVSEASDKMHEIENKDQLNQLIALLRNDLADENDFFANPVELVEDDIFPVPNYGSANAPFYTTLALWVGALLLSNLLATGLHKQDYREDYTSRQIYFGRMILFLIIAILQALIVSIGDITILNVYTQETGYFILFSVLIAIVFMVIVYTFASILGNIGKALMIVLLVLQISSGGGTFPIEVAPPFFQALHPYMPFSYAIDLMREAVAGLVPEIAWYNVMLLGIFLVIALVIGVVLKPLLANRMEKTTEKSKESRLIE
ncbi:YhgE/Pip domain-containing protein [Gracilibacillus timonensis]|uniref:YhgE/Pip domain-containing protein n=1 Tax=Gracilibacillus timonensis TaxID=1816696 RepID=UPI0008242E82|nr:YhgE/Pip domain-containing protein [Gracilibacillus timonensis]